jgi:hypothetical protein
MGEFITARGVYAKVSRYGVTAILLLLCSPAALPAPPEPIIDTNVVRVEQRPVRGGGDLYTYFCRAGGQDSDQDIPFLSVLRDTLGDSDPANDRLRQVWAFTYSTPSIWKRLAAGVPFLYRRAGWKTVSDKKMPPAVIDLASPAHGAPQTIASALLQPMVLDPLGIPWRASSRAYRGRSQEYRMMHVWSAIAVLSGDARSGQAGPLSSEDLDLIQGRLLLSGRLLGGFVEDDYAEDAWRKRRTELAEMRGHNWELLRQRAEEEGLYFEPLRFAREEPAFAMLWVAQDEIRHSDPRRFDNRFLGISDPFRDERVRNWTGYSEIWTVDGSGAPLGNDAAAGRKVRMIPLALYALEYPHVPLLMVDFRDGGKPKRREMIRRVSDDVATGVLGFTGVGHWPYLLAKTAFFFVHARHGGTLNRESRVRAYVRLRHALKLDEALAPPLRAELIARLNQLGVNPLEDSLTRESTIARRQYAALIANADSGALARNMQHERSRELRIVEHSQAARVGLRMATVATLGLYQHRESMDKQALAEVDRVRRFEFHKRYLQQVLAAGPDPAVDANMDAVRTSLRELSEIGQQCQSCRAEAAYIVSRVLSSTTDEQVRAECVECLQILDEADTRAAVVAPVDGPRGYQARAQ